MSAPPVVEPTPGLGEVMIDLGKIKHWCAQQARASDRRPFMAIAKVLEVTARAMDRSPNGLALLYSASALLWREAIAMTLHLHEAPDASRGTLE